MTKKVLYKYSPFFNLLIFFAFYSPAAPFKCLRDTVKIAH